MSEDEVWETGVRHLHAHWSEDQGLHKRVSKRSNRAHQVSESQERLRERADAK